MSADANHTTNRAGITPRYMISELTGRAAGANMHTTPAPVYLSQFAGYTRPNTPKTAFNP